MPAQVKRQKLATVGSDPRATRGDPPLAPERMNPPTVLSVLWPLRVRQKSCQATLLCGAARCATPQPRNVLFAEGRLAQDLGASPTSAEATIVVTTGPKSTSRLVGGTCVWLSASSTPATTPKAAEPDCRKMPTVALTGRCVAVAVTLGIRGTSSWTRRAKVRAPEATMPEKLRRSPTATNRRPRPRARMLASRAGMMDVNPCPNGPAAALRKSPVRCRRRPKSAARLPGLSTPSCEPAADVTVSAATTAAEPPAGTDTLTPRAMAKDRGSSDLDEASMSIGIGEAVGASGAMVADFCALERAWRSRVGTPFQCFRPSTTRRKVLAGPDHNDGASVGGATSRAGFSAPEGDIAAAGANILWLTIAGRPQSSAPAIVAAARLRAECNSSSPPLCACSAAPTPAAVHGHIRVSAPV
mmetsp:Transcript_96899/g.278857  ORF Transcript_96899/g.278857 Transcript_96899/m.278857 type:complete len:414 (-) Transcript_96899:1332-2573(-)